MGYQEISLKLPTDYTEDQLKKIIKGELKIDEFSHQIINKSLDARQKRNIHWLVRIFVSSEELKGENPELPISLEIPYKKRKEKVTIVGSGPAGFFSAYVLQKAGFNTTIIERGCDVNKRNEGISKFEKTGIFDPKSNYSFGEGGAGTFSDGKLTSRSKRIGKEKQFILDSYINAGAPKEIAYLAHPHLGTDNLKIIVKKLREIYESIGGKILFETEFIDLKTENGKVSQAEISTGNLETDYLIISSGHSAYETYRTLINRGVSFRPKNFAIGSRIEHRQEIINFSQWGKKQLPGVKAAEYRLTSQSNENSVYTFCMCPGGIVVPATAYQNTNTVNGMSLYNRDGEFANSACVAGVNPQKLLGDNISAKHILDWVEKLEQSFYELSNNYSAPICSINSFINKKVDHTKIESSYPLGLNPAPLWELLPESISNALRDGLIDFTKKKTGFDTGNILGLESKTSAPIQVLRDKSGLCEGFENLYVVGEGSGYAGGIISSGADGIKAAMNIIEQHS
jgi:hypothetical protein